MMERMSCPKSETANKCTYPHGLPVNTSEQIDLGDAKGHGESLSTKRETSSIPVHDESGAKAANWIYPSEKMFYDAMRRKNWNPNENDMKFVVPIHNAINEVCWKQILEWESLHSK